MSRATVMKVPMATQMELDATVEAGSQTGSQILSKILSPAIRLWLRSQIESAVALEFQVSGRDRQILRGCIPAVQVSATEVIYQGLHLSQAQLKASQIRINLSQVVQGKPLQLLAIVPVVGEIQLTQADLTASSESPLLRQGLTDLLNLLLQSLELPELAGLSIQDMRLQSPKLVLGQDQSTLYTELLSSVRHPVGSRPAKSSPAKSSPPESDCWYLTLQIAPRLVAPSRLQLEDLKLEIVKRHPDPCQTPSKLLLQPLEIDLGSEVNLHQLEITPTQITCIGQVNVVPA